MPCDGRAMRSVLIVLFLLCATSAAPQTAMTAEEFDAYTRGKTLTYSDNGQVFGVEEYLDNRRVRWSYNDGECQDGRWFENGPLICFVYDAIGTPQCWTFRLGANGLIAQFENDPSDRPIYETGQSDEPLLCLGPPVGV